MIVDNKRFKTKDVLITVGSIKYSMDSRGFQTIRPSQRLRNNLGFFIHETK